MATTHSDAAKIAGLDAVVDLIDGGTTDPTGDMEIMTSGDVEVATLTMSNPAFGDASGVGTVTATANAITDDTNATGGTAALHRLRDRNNAEVSRGTVTATGGGGDLELSTVTISAGVTVSVTSYSYESFA